MYHVMTRITFLSRVTVLCQTFLLAQLEYLALFAMCALNSSDDVDFALSALDHCLFLKRGVALVTDVD